MQELLSVWCLQLFSVLCVSRWKTERSNGMIQQHSAPVGTHSARRSANKTPAGAAQRRRPTWGRGGGCWKDADAAIRGGEEGGRGGVLKMSGPVEEHKLLPLAVSLVGVFT